MFSAIAQLLFSAILIAGAWAKLSLESPSQDDQIRGLEHPYLIDSNTLSARAFQLLEEGPAQDLSRGRHILEELLATNASSAEQWSDLGAVLVETGQIEQGKYCYSRAVLLAPNSVETLLSAANFYINTKQVRSALPYLGRILANDSSHDATIFNDYDVLKLDFDELAAAGGIPLEVRPAESYFQHLLGTGNAANAKKLWAWMRPLSPDDRLADRYANFLIEHRSFEEAASLWEMHFGDREPGFGTTTFIFNGDFEREPAGTAFDWHISPQQRVKVNRDPKVMRSGNWSLQITFDGKENSNYQGVSQRVFLRPGRYRLDAFVRAAGITTNEGIGLRALDSETEKVTGTTDWKRLDTSFDVPAETMVEIQVIRHSSPRFDSEIAGTAWIDGVSLTRVR